MFQMFSIFFLLQGTNDKVTVSLLSADVGEVDPDAKFGCFGVGFCYFVVN